LLVKTPTKARAIFTIRKLERRFSGLDGWHGFVMRINAKWS